MIFKPNTYYKHINGRDIALYVIDETLVEDGVEVLGHWMNVHYSELSGKEPFIAGADEIPKPQRVFIHNRRFKEWVEYNVEENQNSL